MNPFVVFGCMVWFIATLVAFFIGPALAFAGVEDGDAAEFWVGLGIFLGSLLSASFFISMIAS